MSITKIKRVQQQRFVLLKKLLPKKECKDAKNG